MKRWRNWGRSADATFAAVATPRNEAELTALIVATVRAGQRIRPMGAGHSFTPVAVTDGISVRLDLLSGVRSVEPDSGLVTLGAGTRLRDLPTLLGPHKLAVQNLGDIDAQSIAGAISTGTHGTGTAFTGMAGQVRGLRIALADGDIVDCSASQRPELFQAARIGLGAFGVITEVTLQCVPQFALAADEHPEPLEAVLDGFDDRMRSADHVEFYWFPHTDRALVKANHRLPADAELAPVPRWRSLVDDELLSNGVFAATCAAGRLAPTVIPSINRLATAVVSQRQYTDLSQRVFTSPRRVRFREMEYAVPRTDLPAVLREIRALIGTRGWRISFPLEIRVAAADDVWLSTAYQRDSAYIALHRYFREPFAEYFLAAERILTAAGGRPHWGKLHTLDAARLAEKYPRFADVRRVRAAVDPQNLFGNAYLDRVLGPVG
ncbi:D-arabinono-1,4-lactone oxidase [Nakamurella lactea]|uniref:D-arabinono-1,4-lactone oxidase n=1 Tax=Nakamurella lactea TaxID=459515 RepID=UPI000412A919|nr:D-arabinono-1,4-lactone oxidase [Nakamurella lactea]